MNEIERKEIVAETIFEILGIEYTKVVTNCPAGIRFDFAKGGDCAINELTYFELETYGTPNDNGDVTPHFDAVSLANHLAPYASK